MPFSLATTMPRPRVPYAHAARSSVRGQWFVRDEAIMGTAIHVELWCGDAVVGHAAADAVIQEMHRIDRAMSPYKPDSELSRVNREAFATPVPVSHEMFTLLQRAAHFSELSDGAFDITYAAVGQLYDYRAGTLPTRDAIARARQAVGHRQLRLDADARSVRFAREGMRIDLGGFAKGYAVDRSIELLRARGIQHASVSAGGDTRILGDRFGRPWIVGIRHPDDAHRVILRIPLENVALSTSGDYERYFDEDGVRYHHIIDPRTGYPATACRSVTVWAGDAFTADAVDDAVFILGPKSGLELVESLPDVGAVIVDGQNQVFVSKRLEGKVRVMRKPTDGI